MRKLTTPKVRLAIAGLLILIIMPIIIWAGIAVLGDRSYYFISIVLVLLASAPFFISLERKKTHTRDILIIAVMAALSVAGRLLFVLVPGFKPVAAITIIAGIYLGAEAGFLTGALAAIVSNIFFGQGPWTPFQMFMWGIIGFIAGLLGKTGLMEKRWALVIYGIIAGVLFSVGMDVWGVISITGVFTWQAYTAALVTAIPFTVMYAISNVVFLLLLSRPIGERLKRIKKKYGMMGSR